MIKALLFKFFLTLTFSVLTQTLFAVCMSGWPNDFVIGEEIGETNEVRKSFNGRVVIHTCFCKRQRQIRSCWDK